MKGFDPTRFENWKKVKFVDTVTMSNLPTRVKRVLLQNRYNGLSEIPPREQLESLSSLYIYGKAGTGKTVMAAQFMLGHIAYQWACRAVLRTEFIGVPELLLEFKNSYGNKWDETETQLLDRYARTGLLVLDDIGVQNTTDWAYQLLYILINRRYDEERPIIFTSNYSLEELREKLDDERIPSRIYEMCDVVSCKKQYRHT